MISHRARAAARLAVVVAVGIAADAAADATDVRLSYERPPGLAGCPSEEELRGLVWSLTERPRDRDVPLMQRPSTFAIIVLLMILALNVIFY